MSSFLRQIFNRIPLFIVILSVLYRLMVWTGTVSAESMAPTIGVEIVEIASRYFSVKSIALVVNPPRMHTILSPHGRLFKKHYFCRNDARDPKKNQPPRVIRVDNVTVRINEGDEEDEIFESGYSRVPAHHTLSKLSCNTMVPHAVMAGYSTWFLRTVKLII